MINPAALAEYRTRAGLSQRKLATLIGVNYQVIRRIEAGGDSGNLTLRDLDRLSDALIITPVDLLTEKVPRPASAAPHVGDPTELDVTQARLLRRLHRGVDVRRGLSTPDRELILPALMNQRLAHTSPSEGPSLTGRVTRDLEGPSPAHTTG